MRAIIKCTTTMNPDDLGSFLSETGWRPNISEDHAELVKQKEDIVNQVPAEDRALVALTLRYVVYDSLTKSWGIVSNPTRHGVTFRIKNDNSDRLKQVCERLIHDLQVVSHKKTHNGQEPASFTFINRVEVLESNRVDHTYSGEILPDDRLDLAVRQKSIESCVGIFAGLVAIVLFFLAIPPVETWILSSLTSEWHDFIKGFLDRLSVSAVVTSTVSLLSVLLHWLHIRRLPTIKWAL